MKSIGIDISKAVFDVAILENNNYKNKQFTNNEAGFSTLLKWVKSDKLTAIYCLEATGIYGLNLAKFLYANQQNIIVANPIKTNAFSKMEMSRNKTDKADAQSIARYAKHIYDKGELEKNLFTPKNKEFERLQFLVTRLEQLGKMKSQETNRLDVSQDKVASKSIKKMLLNIEKQQFELKKEINKTVDSSEELSKETLNNRD